MMRLVFVAVLAAATAGCIIHGPSRRHHHQGPTVVTVNRGHVCQRSCGHYWDRGGWYKAPSHSHGRGCGHRWHGGRWVR